jgi:sn1-specific diacylglycerol lipase
MWNAAKKIADPDHSTSVFYALKSALEENPGYGLVLVGHSLGAAVASLLATFWADLETGKISSNCGLPAGRSFRCFAFGAACAISLNGYSHPLTSF